MHSHRSNYWTKALGFDEDAGLSALSSSRRPSEAPGGTVPRPTPPPQLQPRTTSTLSPPSHHAILSNNGSMVSDGGVKEDTETDLEEWIAQFHARAEEKEKEKARRINDQLNRDDDEMEKWKRIRQEGEALERARQAALAEELAAQDALREQEAAAQREAERILASTQGLTDEQRAQWVADERELAELEAKMSTQASRLEELNEILLAGAAVHDRQREEEREAERQVQLLEQAALAEQEQLKFRAQEAIAEAEEASRLAILEEEPEARRTLDEDMRSAASILMAKARMDMYLSCSSEIRERIDAVTDAVSREQILDELVLLRDLQRSISAIESR